MIERRPIFVSLKKHSLSPFIKTAGLELAGILPQVPYEEKLVLLAIKSRNLRHPEVPKTAKENRATLQPVWVMDDNPEKFIRAARDIIEHKTIYASGLKIPEKEVEDIKDLCNSLIIIKPNAKEHKGMQDPQTKIRVFYLLSGETPFPIHPTPAH